MSEAIFKGVSGRLHRFTVAEPYGDFPSAPAVYAFARPSGRYWVPVFLSRTGNLGERMARHPQWEQARRLGATHVLVHRRGERDAREDVEADLLTALRPVMNGPFVGQGDNLVHLQPCVGSCRELAQARLALDAPPRGARPGMAAPERGLPLEPDRFRLNQSEA